MPSRDLIDARAERLYRERVKQITRQFEFLPLVTYSVLVLLCAGEQFLRTLTGIKA